MHYRLLGNTGLRVAELALGTMTFGEDWGFGADKKTSQQQWDAYAEAGGNFIDTADGYTNGTSEKYVGEFAKSARDRFVIATKYTFMKRQGDPNSGGNHKKNLRQSVEGSLQRMQTDYIDLLWLHAWDLITPIDEVMRALDELVRAGKILHVGVSDMPAWLVARANTLAEQKDWTPFAAIQIEYNLAQRTVERELTPMAAHLGLSVLAWSPLGAGLLSGKFSSQNKDQVDTTRGDNERLTEANLKIADEVIAVAREVGHSPAQVALNWLRAKQAMPIIGARKLDQLKDNLACVDWELAPEQVQRLDDVSAIELGFPHDFLQSDGPKHFFRGDTFDRIIRD
ncbi:MAG: putative oxidoreductase aryl-alcohol dehydrogenase like protein [Puniceicoccaceae bacterium 5H]|nr:MAG: putative oxidoreductase aryl-alcohol dehydrogenase like protein [Puniceicoccaceae bacterium 5H]